MIESTDIYRNDSVHMRCRDRNYRRDASIRVGSFFGNGLQLELEKVVDQLYSYLYKIALLENLMQACRIASEACQLEILCLGHLWGVLHQAPIKDRWSRPCS